MLCTVVETNSVSDHIIHFKTRSKLCARVYVCACVCVCMCVCVCERESMRETQRECVCECVLRKKRSIKSKLVMHHVQAVDRLQGDADL